MSEARTTSPLVDRLPRPLRGVGELLAETVAAGGENDLMLFASAMAYSLLVSLAPLSVMLSLFSRYVAVKELLPSSPATSLSLTADQLYGNLGWAGPAASILALLLVVYGASALFGQLNAALGRIWRQPGGPRGVRAFLRGHGLALLLLFFAAFALFLSAVVGDVVGSVAHVLVDAGQQAGVDLGWIDAVIESRIAVEFVFATLLFLVAYTTVPRIRPHVRDVLPGALLTAAGYSLGHAALGIYLASSSRFTTLGAFGAFLGFLVWVYYTAVIVLWGSQMAHEIARRRACRRGGDDSLPYAC